jgi:hypothetical protein
MARRTRQTATFENSAVVHCGMLESALQATFRNFSTLFLIVAVVVFPLHLAYGITFRDEIAVRELHPEIAELPSDRRVRGVGPAEIDRARMAGYAVWLVEIALIPLFVKAARRALDATERGDVATVADAWRGAFGRAPRQWLPGGPAAVAVGAGIAVLVLLMVEVSGLLLTDMLPDGSRFAGVVVVDTLARSAALPFVLAPLAVGRAPKAARAGGQSGPGESPRDRTLPCR